MTRDRLNTARAWLSKLARSRALHFVLVGGALAALAPKPVDDRAIAIDGPRVFEALRAEQARLGRPLASAEKTATIRGLVDDEVMAREAARLGVGVDDAVVRARLSEQMRASLMRSIPRPAIGEQEVDVAIAREIARSPERMRLAVWFVSKDHPDAVAAADALARAVAGDREKARGLGDRPPIPDGAYWTEEALARVCGPSAARAAATTPTGTATGALASAWGHYVFVPLERRAASADEVRAAAVDAVLRAKTAAEVAKAVARTRREYRIDVALPPGEGPIDLDADPPPSDARGVD